MDMPEITPEVERLIEQLRLLFNHEKLISICFACKHYDRYWYCERESYCSNCAMKDDGIWFEKKESEQ